MNKSLLLASLVAAVALTACGKKEEAPAPAPAPAAAPAPAPAPAPVAEAASAAASAVAGAAAGAASAVADAAKDAAGKAVDASPLRPSRSKQLRCLRKSRPRAAFFLGDLPPLRNGQPGRPRSQRRSLTSRPTMALRPISVDSG
jgi:hypothetical protein